MDDIADLAIETCLMSGVSSLFSRDMVDDLEEDEIHELAKESAEAAEDREKFSAKAEGASGWNEWPQEAL